MIVFDNVSYGFSDKDLYESICFEIEDNEHAVLIGSNGCGKSTLINMIVNTDDYLYDGKILKKSDIRIALVKQFVKHECTDKSVYDYLAEPFVKLMAEADAICLRMGQEDCPPDIYDQYQNILDEIEAIDAYNYDSNIRKILSDANLSNIENNSIDSISGGEYKLVSIIRNMLLMPQLLIMDEPDVFLDFENMVSLTRLINNYKGTVLVVTHNRLLLSQCFNKILHLENKELQEFPGTFAEYNKSMLETKVAMQEQSVTDASEIEKEKAIVERLRKSATFIDSPAKGKQLKARVSYLERLQARQVKNPFIVDMDYDFVFKAQEDESQPKISVNNYSLSYEKNILSDVNFEVEYGEKIAIVGANGCGKSSLLRDIYNMMKDEANISYFTQIYDDSSLSLSGGELNIKQIREICAGDAKILLLDEPTSHLDIYAQVALEKAINEFTGTVIMVTHDFFTVANCADRILLIDNGTVREVSGRSYRKNIYKNYFDSDIFEQERNKKDCEIRINKLLKAGKISEAKKELENLS